MKHIEYIDKQSGSNLIDKHVTENVINWKRNRPFLAITVVISDVHSIGKNWNVAEANESHFRF